MEMFTIGMGCFKCFFKIFILLFCGAGDGTQGLARTTQVLCQGATPRPLKCFSIIDSRAEKISQDVENLSNTSNKLDLMDNNGSCVPGSQSSQALTAHLQKSIANWLRKQASKISNIEYIL